MIVPSQRVIPLDAVNNFRDFGGWRTVDGNTLAMGRLYRSAHLQRATAADLDRIGRLGIATITDLRGEKERQDQPGAWIGKLPLAAIEHAEGALLPNTGSAGEPPHIRALQAGDFGSAALREFMAATYGEMPYADNHIALFRRYFAALSVGTGAILIHCAAGKDRTGILAWLTHRALNVHPDDALADYLLSNEAGNIGDRLVPLRRRLEETYGRSVPDAALIAMLSVEPRYIEACEAALKARSGSVERYLSDVIGITPERRRRLQEWLLAS